MRGDYYAILLFHFGEVSQASHVQDESIMPLIYQ